MTKDIDLRPYRIGIEQACNLASEFDGAVQAWGTDGGKPTVIRIRFYAPANDAVVLYAQFKEALGCYLPP